METKLLEIKDRMTRTFGLAMKFPERHEQSVAEAQIIEASSHGDGTGYVLLLDIDGGSGNFTCDPYDWPQWKGGSRTMQAAHEWICSHWRELENGSVVCVETILGERETPKVSDFAGV